MRALAPTAVLASQPHLQSCGNASPICVNMSAVRGADWPAAPRKPCLAIPMSHDRIPQEEEDASAGGKCRQGHRRSWRRGTRTATQPHLHLHSHARANMFVQVACRQQGHPRSRQCGTRAATRQRRRTGSATSGACRSGVTCSVRTRSSGSESHCLLLLPACCNSTMSYRCAVLMASMESLSVQQSRKPCLSPGSGGTDWKAYVKAHPRKVQKP